MARTNIDIDDDLVAAVMRMYRLASKRSAVDLALRRLVGEPMSPHDVLAVRGSGFDYTNDDVESLTNVESFTNVDSFTNVEVSAAE